MKKRPEKNRLPAHQPCIVTLMTDFGTQDAYVGIMKGVIIGINPCVNIIDICHNIPPQDIFSGAYLLSSSYKYFPQGTVHVAVVDPGVGSKRDIVCVEINKHFFLVPDNGILSFILQEEMPKSIVRVTNNKYFLPLPSATFHGRDIFAPVAAYLSLGTKPQLLGNASDRLNQLETPTPEYTKKKRLIGAVIHIDRFGNLVTNITRKSLKYLSAPHKCLEMSIGKKKIAGLQNTYADAPAGESLFFFGSAGFLEVSVNQGNAQTYFKAKRGDKISVGIKSSVTR